MRTPSAGLHTRAHRPWSLIRGQSDPRDSREDTTHCPLNLFNKSLFMTAYCFRGRLSALPEALLCLETSENTLQKTLVSLPNNPRLIPQPLVQLTWSTTLEDFYFTKVKARSREHRHTNIKENISFTRSWSGSWDPFSCSCTRGRGQTRFRDHRLYPPPLKVPYYCTKLLKTLDFREAKPDILNPAPQSHKPEGKPHKTSRHRGETTPDLKTN